MGNTSIGFKTKLNYKRNNLKPRVLNCFFCSSVKHNMFFNKDKDINGNRESERQLNVTDDLNLPSSSLGNMLSTLGSCKSEMVNKLLYFYV